MQAGSPKHSENVNADFNLFKSNERISQKRGRFRKCIPEELLNVAKALIESNAAYVNDKKKQYWTYANI